MKLSQISFHVNMHALGVWLVFFLVCTPICFFGTWRGLEDQVIAGREGQAVAVMMRYHPEDHAKYDYVFRVDVARFMGRDYFPGEKLGGVSIGKKAKVYYDTANPARNATSSFADSARGRYFYPAFWLLLFAGATLMARVVSRKWTEPKGDYL